MKKGTFLLIALCGAFVSFSQTKDLKKPASLGLNFFLKDFTTPHLIAQNGLGTVLRDKSWAKPKDMSPGVSLQYFEGLTNYVDFMGTLNASFVDYVFGPAKKYGQSSFLLETSANVNVKLLTDNYFLVPYLYTGIGLSMYAGTYFGAYIPVGAGLQFKLGEGNFVHLQLVNNVKVTENTNGNFQYSLGFASPLKDKKETAALAAPAPPAPLVKN
jgi:hypothetical protein